MKRWELWRFEPKIRLLKFWVCVWGIPDGWKKMIDDWKKQGLLYRRCFVLQKDVSSQKIMMSLSVRKCIPDHTRSNQSWWPKVPFENLYVQALSTVYVLIGHVAYTRLTILLLLCPQSCPVANTCCSTAFRATTTSFQYCSPSLATLQSVPFLLTLLLLKYHINKSLFQ